MAAPLVRQPPATSPSSLRSATAQPGAESVEVDTFALHQAQIAQQNVVTVDVGADAVSGNTLETRRLTSVRSSFSAAAMIAQPMGCSGLFGRSTRRRISMWDFGFGSILQNRKPEIRNHNICNRQFAFRDRASFVE